MRLATFLLVLSLFVYPSLAAVALMPVLVNMYERTGTSLPLLLSSSLKVVEVKTILTTWFIGIADGHSTLDATKIDLYKGSIKLADNYTLAAQHLYSFVGCDSDRQTGSCIGVGLHSPHLSVEGKMRGSFDAVTHAFKRRAKSDIHDEHHGTMGAHGENDGGYRRCRVC